MTIGQTLADRRQRAGYSVAQLSEHTRIRPHIIAAIERDEFTACGGDVYARGHIRSLARILGLDPLPLVAHYDAVHASAAPPRQAPRGVRVTARPTRRRRWSGPLSTWSVVAAAALLVTTVAVTDPRPDTSRAERAATSQAADPTDPPADERPAEPREPAAEPEADDEPAPEPVEDLDRDPDKESEEDPDEVRLRLHAAERTWVQIRDAAGGDLFTGILDDGESRDWTDPETLSVRLGNAGGVEIDINEEPHGPPGAAGEVIQLTVDGEGVRPAGAS